MSSFNEWFVALSGSDYIDFVMLVFSVLGGLFALVQWERGNKIKRAEFINSLIEKLRSDEEIEKTIFMFDYNQNWYSRSFHNSKDNLEHEVDKTLSFFSYICYLRKKKLIRKSDFQFFNYEIRRIADNYSVQAYLFNLYHFSQKRDVEMTFCYLFDYCYENKLFGNDTEIKNSVTSKYPKYLNF